MLWKRGIFGGLAAPKCSKRVELAAKNLAVVQTACGGPRDSDSGLHNVLIQDVRSVSSRVHPAFDYGLGVGVTEGDILRQAAVRIPHVARSVDQSGQISIGYDVSHFLEPRHVAGLDLRHPIQLRVVDECRQTLVPPLSVDEIEYPGFGRTERAARRVRCARRGCRRDWRWCELYGTSSQNRSGRGHK